MKTYNNQDLQEYNSNDWIKELLDKQLRENKAEDAVRYNKWLYEMDNKRMIYAEVYGDLLRPQSLSNKQKVLDVGGGYTSLTRILAENCDYTLVDFLAHGGEEEAIAYNRNEKMNWINMDWYNMNIDDNYDIVISNDLFPDVDQRMELFIEKFLPVCKEIRLVLTYYNTPKFYTTKRIDDPEVMTFLSWDGEITSIKLRKYLSRIIDTSTEELDMMKTETSSIYRNGRQVSYIRIKGDLK